MKYILSCTSIWRDELNNILSKYPKLKDYKIETDYPYPNKEYIRIIIEVANLIKFYDDISENGADVVLSKQGALYSLEIYDGYRE